ARGRLERPHTSVRRPTLTLEHTRWPQKAKFPEWENADDPTPIFPKKKSSKTRGVAPDLEQIPLHCLHSGGVQAVNASRAARLLHHQAGVFQQAQMARHRRPTDRQRVRDFA